MCVDAEEHHLLLFVVSIVFYSCANTHCLPLPTFFFFRCCQFLTEPTPCPSTTSPHLRLSSKVKRRPFFFVLYFDLYRIYIYIYIYISFFFLCVSFLGLDVRLGPVCVFFYRVCYNTSIARSQLSARCVYFSLCRASMDTCFASQISPFFFSAVLLF